MTTMSDVDFLESHQPSFRSASGLAVWHNRYRGNRGETAPVQLLVAHGLWGSCAADAALALPDWRECASWGDLFRYDARGHGLSVGGAVEHDYSWESLAGDLVEVLQGCSTMRLSRGEVACPAPWVLIGASMGAASVLHAIASSRSFCPGVGDSPVTQSNDIALHSVRALVLAIPPTSWETRDPMRQVYREWADRIRSQGTQSFWDYLGSLPPTPCLARARPSYRKILEPFAVRTAASHLASAFAAAASSDLPSREALRRITLPTLILCRHDDPTHPVAMGEMLAEILPCSELHIARSGGDIQSWPDLVGDFVRRSGK